MKTAVALVMLSLFLSSFGASAQKIDNGHGYDKNGEQKTAKTLLFSISTPYIEKKKVLQELDYKSSGENTATIQVSCTQLRANDSVCLYHLEYSDIKLKSGVSSYIFDLSEYDRKIILNTSFFEALKKAGTLPPGIYRTVVNVNGEVSYQEDFLWEVDSMLSHNTDLRGRLNGVFENKKRTNKVNRSKKQEEQSVTNTTLDRSTKKVNKSLKKFKGVKAIPAVIGGKTYNELFYESWFLGRYEIVAGKSMKDRIANEKAAMKDNSSTFVSNDINDFTGITSQMKRLNKRNKCDNETLGLISFATTFGNGQEPGSEQENTYQEVTGQIGTTVMNIPIIVEGYFTTQDFNRNVKGSYIRARYDVESAKSGLTKLINGYRNKFMETSAKSQGIESVQGIFLENLKQEQQHLLFELTNEYGFSKDIPKTGNFDELLAKQAKDSDTTAQARARREKLNKNKDKAKEKYDKVVANEQKIKKYSKLVEQYRTKLYFDSAITTTELNKLQDGDNVSYKKMAKSSRHLLPEGKASSFLAGLTKLEVGMLNQYESNYTMNGQTLKGGNIGYDFGLVKASAAAGKTEYISRDGTLDKYNSLMGRIDYEPVSQQNIGLVYYVYAPTQQIFNGSNFLKRDVNIPNLSVPIHILSLTYTGNVNKDLFIEAESAVSQRQSLNAKKVGLDNNASKIAVEYSIPITTASVRAEYEHMGQDFENTSLPFIKSASERYIVSTKVDLLRSIVTVGVQYNFLKQLAFSSTGYSKKWGFDVKTNFKQYPNLQLSYKPFSTFRSYSDTMTVPQRPMFGEVWIARATYQIKRLGQSHRFNILYNQNNSNIDGNAYQSATLQAGYIFSSGPSSFNGTIGWMKSPANDSINTIGIESTYFVTGSVTRQLNKEFTTTIGQELGFARFGVQRYSSIAGGEYRPERIPLSFRLMLRYSAIRMSESTSAKNLIAGQLGVNWRFKLKKNCDRL